MATQRAAESLTAVLNSDEDVEAAFGTLSKHLEDIRQSDWEELQSYVNLHALPKACMRGMECNHPARMQGAAAYIAILGAEGSPTLSLLDSVTLTAAFRRVKERHNSGKGAKSGDEQRRENETDAATLSSVFQDLQSFIASISLQEHPDNLKAVIDLLTHVIQAGSDSNGKAADCIMSLLDPRHGEELNTSALVMQALMPGMLGIKGTQKNGSKAALALVERIASEIQVAQPAVAALLRQLCLNCPAKAGNRSLVVDAACKILQVLPRAETFSFAGFVSKLSNSPKGNQRHLAVEMAAAMLERLAWPFTAPQAESGDNEVVQAGDANQNLWGEKCLLLLVSRSYDKGMATRAKALTALSNVLEILGKSGFASPVITNLLRRPERETDRDEEMMAERQGEDDRDGEDEEKENVGTNQCANKTGNRVATFGSKQAQDSGDSDIFSMLKRRCEDAKGNVRKAALQCWGACTRFLCHVQEDHVICFEKACHDPLVTVRKQALITMSCALGACPLREFVVRAWVRCILKQAADHEVIIQDKCAEELRARFWDCLPELARGNDEDASQKLKTFLESFAHSSMDGVTPGVAIKLLSARSMIKKQSLTALVRCIERTDLPVPAREGLWILLQHTSLHVPDAVHWKVLKSEFEKCKECQEGQGQVNACIARTISNSASKIPNDERESLRKEMHARLKGLNLLTESVSAYMEALAKLSDSGCNSWIEDICRDAQRLLESYINGESVNVSHVNRALFTVGEAVIICNNVVNDSLKNLVQALLAPSVGRLEGIDGEPLKKLSDRSVQTQAWVALGKLCIVDEKLAKRCVPFFVQELGRSSDSAIRNNILIILSDLCVRHTALVDPYIYKMANALCDSCELVRRQAVVLLDSLLQRDFIKWKGPLFIRFCRTLADKSVEVRKLSHQALKHHLAVKAPLLAYNNFVEAVFAFNNKSSKPEADAFAGTSDEEREAFVLAGSATNSRVARRAVYKLLLKAMSAEHRLATAAKLSNDLLAAVCDDQLPMEEYEEILHDALSILASEEMQFSQMKLGSSTAEEDGEDDAGEEEGCSQSQGAGGERAVKKRLLTGLAKKNIAENVVPVLIELRRKAEAERSWLTGLVMECFKSLLQGEDEQTIDDVLSGDAQIAQEIKHELKSGASTQPC